MHEQFGAVAEMPPVAGAFCAVPIELAAELDASASLL
jgi:hypothetical protein